MPDGIPLVSVVIPCFKATEYIADALNSLRAQVFRDFEVILVNDGCPDTVNLERVLEPYQGEIRYLKPAQWGGVSLARNHAIQASHARYVAFLDSDDIWEPNYLQILVPVLEKDPSIDLIFPDARYFGGSAWDEKTFLEVNPPAEGGVTVEKLISRRVSVFICSLARRESLIRAGLFDPELRGGEDWDLWMRLVRSGGKIAYRRELLARYRIRQGSASADKVDLLRNALSVCEKHLNLPEITEQERRWFEGQSAGIWADINLVLAKQAIYRQRRADAIDLLSKANTVFKNRRFSLTILALRLAPWLVFSYVHRKYPTEYVYLH